MHLEPVFILLFKVLLKVSSDTGKKASSPM